ncbi:MAG: transcriptional regulator ClgR [Actinomycetota bacterium]|jgi:transcriptional regulator with XRE-family HTH domain
MTLWREVLGTQLRSIRISQNRTLRDISASANVALGYLSEIERGHKEASSELLASICGALNIPVSTLMSRAASTLAREEVPATVVSLPVGDSTQKAA